MKIRCTKVAYVGWMIAAILLFQMLLVTDAHALKYEKYRIDGCKLTEQEKYVLAQTETNEGMIADLLEKFVLPLIPDKDKVKQLREFGLTGYLEKINDRERKVFLKNYGDRLRIRSRFLEILLTDGFNNFKIHRHGVMIKNAFIKENLNFEDAEVKHNFSINRSILLGGANLRDCWFKKHLLFEEVNFVGDTDFIRLEVGKGFSVRRARFFNEKELNFSSLKVGQNACFVDTIFYGPVTFAGTNIGCQFIANGTQFLSEEKVNFNGVKLGESAFFKNVIFKGPVDFVAANIGGQLNAEGAQFLNNGKNNFESIKIGHYGIFRKIIFNGNIVFSNGNFLDLIIQGNNNIGKNDNNENQCQIMLALEGATIQRKLIIMDINIGKLNAINCQVRGEAIFDGLQINALADFQNSSIRIINILKTTWPIKREDIRLDGLTYDRICVDESENYKNVKQLFDRCRFNTMNYLQLESYFRRCGNEDWANRAFISMKDQELAKRSWMVRGIIKFFWGWLAGYGRNPLRVLWISLGLVVFGALIFNTKYLEESKRPAVDEIYQSVLVRLFLSIDQFLPAVDMGLAKDWKAAANPFYIWAYFAFLQISGYILVPIGLAAIYTQIK